MLWTDLLLSKVRKVKLTGLNQWAKMYFTHRLFRSQSPMFDGKTPNWHHVKCFFMRSRPKAVGDIAHYDQLRWEDQEKIR